MYIRNAGAKTLEECGPPPSAEARLTWVRMASPVVGVTKGEAEQARQALAAAAASAAAAAPAPAAAAAGVVDDDNKSDDHKSDDHSDDEDDDKQVDWSTYTYIHIFNWLIKL
jgi:hypothetical protein